MGKVSKNGVEVYWYGERGIMNVIALALERSGVRGVKGFLQAITWGGDAPTWIDDLIEVSIIVELNCGQFGSPDLMMICMAPDGTRYVLFVEAKTVSYKASAKSLKGSNYNNNFNSSINGQIMLKYRLANALSNWDAKGREIEEPKHLYEAYSSHSIEKTRQDSKIHYPRFLKRQRVLSILKRCNANVKDRLHYYYIALTWDCKPYFKDASISNEDKPLFLGKNKTDVSHNLISQLGWINYTSIKNIEALARYLGDSFEQACIDMDVDDIPTMDNSNYDSTPSITSISCEKCSSDIQTFVASVLGIANERICDLAVGKCSGGISVKYQSKVIAKIVTTQKNTSKHVLFGVSTVLNRTTWNGIKGFKEWHDSKNGIARIGGGNKQPFFVYEIIEFNNSSVEAIIDTILEIEEVLCP